MNKIIYLIAISFLLACSHTLPESEKLNTHPSLFPDYVDVTIPPNIAPLPFKLSNDTLKGGYAVFTTENRNETVQATNGQFRIQASAWKKLLQASQGKSLSVTVYAKGKSGKWQQYLPFRIHVADEPVDSYMAYRLIEPGYMLWNKMGIYQRNLENYKQTAILENKMTGGNCMNCHSFCMQNPDKMLFHLRAAYDGTIVAEEGEIEKLNTKTDQTISNLVYPSWHPSGRYVAFSVNETGQNFHLTDANRVEVFDKASDVVIYDIEKHEIISAPSIFSKQAFETFPTFSPDGRTLYFCSAPAMAMPQSFEDVQYSLCAVSFNPHTKTFGAMVDTLYNAGVEGKSASFPRVSPDGKHLVYTLASYGNFSIWHKDADLYIIDLQTKETIPLTTFNSNDVESYHSWSSNSRWMVFSSRRIDGLYTRPFIGYIGADGKAAKPFLVPQDDTEFYARLMKSYNIPEFITGKVTIRESKLASTIKNDKGLNLTFGGLK